MAINAINFDSSARLTVNLAAPVIVLFEMAIVALHSFFQMNVRKVHRLTKAIRIVECDLLAVFVEPVSFAVVTKHGAEDPSMPVKVRELRRLQLLVEVIAASLCQKFLIAPKPARRCRFGIPQIRLMSFFLRRIALLFGI